MHARNYKCINNVGCETARKKRIGIWDRGVRMVD
jgi:hypothetical protein